MIKCDNFNNFITHQGPWLDRWMVTHHASFVSSVTESSRCIPLKRFVEHRHVPKPTIIPERLSLEHVEKQIGVAKG